MTLVAIGTTEFLPGFALAGVRKTILADSQTVLARIEENRNAALIIVDEKLLAALSPVAREQLELSITPIIIVLGQDDASTQRLRQNIRETIGADLFR
jgi:V/A-type H+/Na+-transporting ATPase subunit F